MRISSENIAYTLLSTLWLLQLQNAGESCGVNAGMRYGKKASEFGVPRGSTAWRARGPPMAITEPRTQYLAILSQPHSCSDLRGIFSNPSRSDYPAGHCKAIVTPGNMLLRFIPHANRYRILGDLLKSSSRGSTLPSPFSYVHIQYVGPRLPLCTIVFLYSRMGA
jgi:hypothetical protein